MFRNEKYSNEIQYGLIGTEVQEKPAQIIDTNFVHHDFRDMKKNVTVVMDEETARWVRVRAAHDDLSISAFLGAVLKRERERDEGYTQAMERFLSREPRSLAPSNTKLPDREELHER